MRPLVLLASLLALSALPNAAFAQSATSSNVFVDVTASSLCDLSPYLVCTMQFAPVKLNADIALHNRTTGAVRFVRAEEGAGDVRLEPGLHEVKLLWHSKMRGAQITSFEIEPKYIRVDLLPNGQISQFLTPFRVRRIASERSLTGRSVLTPAN